ncbi:hypothetical protein Xhom_03497 [Xenorhabdus hominickii]|uniref:Uncharacterized protein n=1 Tax=Xenorhabdus hominickii TaxID=351679 RepID=A0A2G0Q2R3_XENHO|nr:hypothetical protein Xhom_03497 [Xenorhabdus hominickii]
MFDVIEAMPEPISSLILLIILLGITYFLLTSWFWFISVPLGLFFAFLFTKKAKTKITKIACAFLTLLFLAPPITALFFRELSLENFK